MENQEERFEREWPQIDVVLMKDDIAKLIEERKLEHLDDVELGHASPGQVVVRGPDGTWTAGTINGGGSPGLTDHGALSGLDDDDHPQYLTAERAHDLFWDKQETEEQMQGYTLRDDFDTLQSAVDEMHNTPVTLESLGGAPLDHNHDDRYYTKEQTNNALSNKANTNHVYSHSGLSGLESDDHPQYLNLVRGKLNFNTKQEIADSLALKSDVSELNAVRDRVNSLENSPQITLESLGGVQKSIYLAKVSEFTDRITLLENDPDVGVTVHNQLTGLDADDHPQYLNNSRGDVRYYTKTASDARYPSKLDLTTLAGRVNVVESRPVIDSPDDIGAAPVSHTHSISDVTGLQTGLDAKASASGLTSLTTRVNTLETAGYAKSTEVDNKIQLYPLTEYGFHSMSCPIGSNLNILAMVLGKLFLTRVYVPAGNAINKISFAVKGIGLLPNINASGVALYSDAGVMISSVADNALFASVGWKTATLPTGVSAQSTGKFYWVGLLCNFVTLASIYSSAENPWNGGVNTSHRRNISNSALLANFPASFNPATYGSNEVILPLVALSA